MFPTEKQKHILICDHNVVRQIYCHMLSILFLSVRSSLSQPPYHMFTVLQIKFD